MIVVGRARSPCRTSTFLNRRPLLSPLFWLSFLWCFSLVSVRGGAFLLFQFAVIFSLVSACCGAFSRLSQDNRGTRSGPMSKKHPPRRTNVAFSPLLLQFAVELYEMLALKCCARGCKTTHRRLNTSILSETYHCHMMVDPHVQKTHFPRQDNSGTCSGPMSKKQSPREMIIAGRARSPCRKSTLHTRRPSPSPLFWLSFLWCFSPVSARCCTFFCFSLL